MISLLIFIVVVGLLVWILSLLPIPAPFNQIILVVGIIIVIIAVLDFFMGSNVVGNAGSNFRFRN